MVERIWLAAEEPSAANQILLRHSGPILSLKHEPDTVAAPTNTSHEIFINVSRFFMEKLKIDLGTKRLTHHKTCHFTRQMFNYPKWQKNLVGKETAIATAEVIFCIINSLYNSYTYHVRHWIILSFQLCKSATEKSSKVGISAHKPSSSLKCQRLWTSAHSTIYKVSSWTELAINANENFKYFSAANNRDVCISNIIFVTFYMKQTMTPWVIITFNFKRFQTVPPPICKKSNSTISVFIQATNLNWSNNHLFWNSKQI